MGRELLDQDLAEGSIDLLEIAVGVSPTDRAVLLVRGAHDDVKALGAAGGRQHGVRPSEKHPRGPAGVQMNCPTALGKKTTGVNDAVGPRSYFFWMPIFSRRASGMTSNSLTSIVSMC